MKVFEEPYSKVDIKDDNTPVTHADLAENRILTIGLKKLFPKIPEASRTSSGVDVKLTIFCLPSHTNTSNYVHLTSKTLSNHTNTELSALSPELWTPSSWKYAHPRFQNSESDPRPQIPTPEYRIQKPGVQKLKSSLDS